MRVWVVSAAAAAAEAFWRREALAGQLRALLDAGHEVSAIELQLGAGAEAGTQDIGAGLPREDGAGELSAPAGWRWALAELRGGIAGVSQYSLQLLAGPPIEQPREAELAGSAAALAALAQRSAAPPELIFAHGAELSFLPLLARDRFAGVRVVHRWYDRLSPRELPLSWGRAVGFSEAALSTEGMEYFSELSPTKAALLWADRVELSSEAALSDAKDPAQAGGLAGVLSSRGEAVAVTRPQVDLRRWDPAADLPLPARFNAEQPEGKAACKARLQAVFGLPIRSDVLLAAMLQLPGEEDSSQAVLSLVERGLPDDLQLAARGLSPALAGVKERRDPGLGLRRDAAGRLSRLLLAGADVLLCRAGLPGALDAQLGLRYGCRPIGLAEGALPELSAPSFLVQKDSAMGWTAALAEARAAFAAEGWAEARAEALAWRAPALPDYAALPAGGPLGLSPQGL